MALDKEIKEQLAQYLALLESEVVFQASLASDDNSIKVKEFFAKIYKIEPEKLFSQVRLKVKLF